VNDHGWTRLNVQDWTTEHGSAEYDVATFRRAVTIERHPCCCHTNLCTRVATREDLLCDECRGHPDCYAQ